MSEEQTWVYHAGLDRWSEVSGTSLEAWAELGWEHRPEGPVVDYGDRFSEWELEQRAQQLGQIAPAGDLGIQVIPAAQEVSIETPEPEGSTDPGSSNQDSGTPQED